ncbi:ABC transporter substrate-binding protein [Dactylosporangium sp. CA-139114]|uniref:ABC transporter substrate-binding protein n=1 Tax=Dactylosporangium sp. CA-139114 TaxID=3239931 RepID=UPI003D975486
MVRTTNGRTAVATLAALALGVSAAGCGGSPGGDRGAKGDGTVTIAVNGDPGTLSPMQTLVGTALSINRFAYASLVSIGADGQLQPAVATKWTATATSATFTIRDGVTCQDGSRLTAADVAAEFNYIGDPANKVPLIGLTVPGGAKATADDAANTVTVTAPSPAPFIVQNTALLPLLCQKDLKEPAALAKASAATGPYQLSEAVPGDHYTYVKRAGYTWGPGGATNADMPAKVVFKVITNETTAANLLLSGQLQVAQILGADGDRLDAARMQHQDAGLLFGQLIFNEAGGHVTADEPVRRALVQAADLKQLGSVATSGRPADPKHIGELDPAPCGDDVVSGNVPPHDAAAAAAALTGAGWAKDGGGIWAKGGKQLTVGYLYSTAMGPAVASASELAAKQWTEFGAKVVSRAVDPANLMSTLSGGDWDVAWQPFNVYSPDQLVPFFSGPRPPQGNNLAGIANPDYDAGVRQAMATPGADGCPLWTKAESALVKRLDVVPFAMNTTRYYGKGVTFQADGAGVVPGTLRAGG